MSGWNGAKTLDKIPTKNLTLAFLLSANGVPKFDGSMDVHTFVDQAKKVQAKGGKIRISFGGATGTELAADIKDVTKLAKVYEDIIVLYNTRNVDFDIEGAPASDKTTIDRRNKAIAVLQKKYKDLHVDYTLATMQTGMETQGLDILKNAKTNGVIVNSVNLMTMDYGNNEKDMGKAAISAATAAKKQCDAMGLKYTGIGITPMILLNDTAPETFTLQDATEVVAFANKTKWVNFLGFWATGRDTKSWDFMKEFNKFK